MHKIAGASAGSLAAVGLLCDVPLGEYLPTALCNLLPPIHRLFDQRHANLSFYTKDYCDYCDLIAPYKKTNAVDIILEI